MFEPNVGGLDRQLRFVAGGLLVLAGLALLATGTGWAALAGVVGGGALLVNAVTRRCLVNRLLGVDTCERA